MRPWFLIGACAVVFTSAAVAQQRQQGSIEQQALSQKLLEEINSNIQLRIQLMTAQTRLKELEHPNSPPGSQEQSPPGALPVSPLRGTDR